MKQEPKITDYEFLNNPGVYRFSGLDPLTKNENCILYVGKSGHDYIKKKQKDPTKKVQLMKERIERHLKNDAGEVGKLVDNFFSLKLLEVWPLDVKKFDSNDNFNKFLAYFEYFVRSRSENIPYYDEMNYTNIQEIKPPSPDSISFAENIFENGRKEINFSDYRISSEEKRFMQFLQQFNQPNVKNFFKFRQYNKIQFIMKNFIDSWELMEKKNYHWLKLELEDDDFLNWDDWISNYITFDTQIFDLDSNFCVKFDKNEQKIYRNEKEIDPLIESLIEKCIKNETQYEGIVGIMYWRINEKIIPLHMTISKNVGKKTNFRDKRLARWGYQSDRVFGDLAKTFFNDTEQKYQRWFDVLFIDQDSLKLKRSVYFSAFLWPYDKNFGLNKKVCSIEEIKKQIIEKIKPELNHH
ncbi:hypothetical protein NEF87_000466 [Candidatus Lokiarchaeum ossiferum]|uniref:GIY-YIG domain-containing protein n=1 Tax=Candidatus Lokiarchaeum ossiferum TaxID=2951803 RepID=A0ABY6HL79_9ARCH|nr:hypothetical protein NEF87_000466 [Candidatus Lokiarchaeum sp. B-35]